MFKFIHTADIHLDSSLKGLEVYEDAPIDEIRGATRRAFENLIEIAIEEEIDFILISGDLYDGDWKDHNTGIFFARQMGLLKNAGIKVFIVLGNHDSASQITKNMPLPENVFVFSPRKPESIKIEDIGVIIHGQSYSSRSVTENLVSKYPRFDSDFFNIGLLHTSLTGREGHENYAPCTLDDLTSKGYDYWALGHIHKREIVAEDPMVVFPGNIQGRHIKETGKKGVTIVTVEDGLITKKKQLSVDVLRWAICEVDLSECETNSEIYDTIRSAMDNEKSMVDGRTLAIRLHLLGNCSLHSVIHANAIFMKEEIRGITASLGNVWLEKVQIKTKNKIDILESVGEDSPISGLIDTVQSLDLTQIDLVSMIPDLVALKIKLPAELLDNDNVLMGPPDAVNELKDEVKELLVALLNKKGGEI